MSHRNQSPDMQKLRFSYCNKQITTSDNGIVQFHDQEECKLNSTINANSCAHTLTHGNKNYGATIKSKKMPVRYVQ